MNLNCFLYAHFKNIQFSGIQYIYNVRPPPPLSSSRTRSHPQEISAPIIRHAPTPQPLMLIYFLCPCLYLPCTFHINGFTTGLLCLSSLTQHVFKIHPCYSMYKSFILCYSCMIFHCISYLFIHLSVDQP